MNIRELIAWGLVYRERKPGDRKDYFVAEKDVWEISQKIVAERRKRELEPMMKMLEQLLDETTEASKSSTELKHFHSMISDIVDLGKKSRALLDLVTRLDRSSFFKPLKMLLKGR